MDSSKKLVKKAIKFQKPERIPLEFRSNPKKSDIVSINYRPAKGWQPKQEGEDEWGCIWRNLGTGQGQVVFHPLADWDNFKNYSFPDPDAEGRFDEVKKEIKKYKSRYLVGNLGHTLFNRMSPLRGFENLLLDIYIDREKFEELGDKILGFEMEIIEKFSQFKLDGIIFFDDWGTEKALIINPQKWREVFKPLYKKEFALIHRKGMDVYFHSCGYVWDIIPDLIEIGVDILNLEQPLIFSTKDLNGIDRLAQEFGGKVTFLSCVDSQRTLIKGSKEQIEKEAKHLIKALGKYNGGFIALADCGADHGFVPKINIETMAEVFEKYGKKL